MTQGYSANTQTLEVAAMREQIEATFLTAVTLQRSDSTRNAFGETVTDYISEAGDLDCMIQPLGGGELVKAQVIRDDIRWRMDFAYSRTVLANDRIVWDGDTYEVVHVAKDEERFLFGYAYLARNTDAAD